jgi:antibiotic biosynthesis monooxygenase (ABM) superfamily enzyme
VLFFVKYFLPARYDCAINKSKFETKEILTEFIHFPSEMLMVAIGYTIPKILILLSGKTISSEAIFSICLNLIMTLIFLILIFFIVPETKITVNYWFAGEKQKAKRRILVTYIVSTLSIIISLILGV